MYSSTNYKKTSLRQDSNNKGNDWRPRVTAGIEDPVLSNTFPCKSKTSLKTAYSLKTKITKWLFIKPAKLALKLKTEGEGSIKIL